MISFTRIPYADARRRARTQWRVVAVAVVGLGVAILASAARLFLSPKP